MEAEPTILWDFDGTLAYRQDLSLLMLMLQFIRKIC